MALTVGGPGGSRFSGTARRDVHRRAVRPASLMPTDSPGERVGGRLIRSRRGGVVAQRSSRPYPSWRTSVRIRPAPPPERERRVPPLEPTDVAACLRVLAELSADPTDPALDEVRRAVGVAYRAGKR